MNDSTGGQPAEGAAQVRLNDSEVICPNCVHQFPAIPVNVQRRQSAMFRALWSVYKAWGRMPLSLREGGNGDVARAYADVVIALVAAGCELKSEILVLPKGGPL